MKRTTRVSHEVQIKKGKVPIHPEETCWRALNLDVFDDVLKAGPRRATLTWMGFGERLATPDYDSRY